MRAAVLLAALLAASAAVALAHEDDRLCLTPDVSDEASDRVEEIMDRFRDRVCPLLEPGTLNMCGGPIKRAPTVIPVVWNVFYDPNTEEGNISDRCAPRYALRSIRLTALLQHDRPADGHYELRLRRQRWPGPQHELAL